MQVVSHEEAPSPLYSMDTTLNPPSDLPGMIHHIYMAVPIALEGRQLDNHVASNIHERGQPISLVKMRIDPPLIAIETK